MASTVFDIAPKRSQGNTNKLPGQTWLYEPGPFPAAPGWSGGYTPILALQQQEETATAM